MSEQPPAAVIHREAGQEPLARLYLQPMARNVQHYLDKWRDREIFDFDAPYQRGLAWTDEQSRALIRSLLLGIPVGAILLNQRPRTHVYVVVDGKQRIMALRAFHEDRFPVPAWWFEDAEVSAVRPDGTVTYSDLTRLGQRGFENLPMPSLEGQLRNVRAEAEAFGLINTGGTPQTSETIAAAQQIAAG